MYKLSDSKNQQIKNTFSIDNLLKQLISYDTAKQINKLVLESITEIENIEKQLKKTLKAEENKTRLNTHYIINNYKIEYENFKKQIEKMKNSIGKQKNRKIKQSDIYDSLLSVIIKVNEEDVMTLETYEYDNVSVIYKIDNFVVKFLSYASCKRLVTWLNDKKSLASIVYQYDDLYCVLREYKLELVENDLKEIFEQENKLLIEKIFLYIMKMAKYYLINYYYGENMSCNDITGTEICYTTLVFFEYIFGYLNTAIFILFIRNYYSFVDLTGDNLSDFQSDPYKDEQIIKLDDYKNKIIKALNDNFEIDFQ